MERTGVTFQYRGSNWVVEVYQPYPEDPTENYVQAVWLGRSDDTAYEGSAIVVSEGYSAFEAAVARLDQIDVDEAIALVELSHEAQPYLTRYEAEEV